jgi:hypothetical protein
MKKAILLSLLFIFSISFSPNEEAKKRHGSVSSCFTSNYSAYTWTWNNFHLIANNGGVNIETSTTTMVPGIVCVIIDYDYYSVLPLRWNPDKGEFEPE